MSEVPLLVNNTGKSQPRQCDASIHLLGFEFLALTGHPAWACPRSAGLLTL